VREQVDLAAEFRVAACPGMVTVTVCVSAGVVDGA
jgi:hypothetical protein